MDSLSFRRFPRVSPFVVVLLTLFTIGFYLPWWLYTRTQIINQLQPQKPVPMLWVALCMGGLIMLLVLVFQMPAYDDMETLMASPEFKQLWDAAMVINLLQFIWALFICHRINACTQRQMGDPLYASYFMLLLSHLFIVSIFYLQFKINQLIDEDAQPQAPIGIM